VEDKLVAAPQPRHVVESLSEDPLADALISDDFARVRTFGRRILRMGAVHRETTTVGQDFVQLAVVVGVRPFPLSLDFEPPGIEQRIFVLIIPDGVRQGDTGIMPDDRERIRNWIGSRRIPGCNAKFCFRSEYAWSRRGC